MASELWPLTIKQMKNGVAWQVSDSGKQVATAKLAAQ